MNGSEKVILMDLCTLAKLRAMQGMERECTYSNLMISTSASGRTTKFMDQGHTFLNLDKYIRDS